MSWIKSDRSNFASILKPRSCTTSASPPTLVPAVNWCLSALGPSFREIVSYAEPDCKKGLLLTSFRQAKREDLACCSAIQRHVKAESPNKAKPKLE